jgi:5-methylthioadenosine/S-adenosylhomocysteine deaminase
MAQTGATASTTTTLIRNGIVIPCEGRKVVFDPGSVLIVGTGIAAVGPVEELDRDPRAAGATIVDATGQVVIPGLHNCHLHSGLLRGTAESMSLWDWLENYVDPAHKVMTPEIAEAASYMAYTEGLLTGTVSVMDMWRFMDGSARAADEIGIRATLVPYTADLYDYFETLETNRRLLETHLSASDGRVRTWVGLEHIMYCSAEMFRAAADLAAEFDTGIHTHSSESIWEVQQSLKLFGRRPIEEFYNRGILGAKTVVAHCVWLDDREIALMAQTGTSVAHCPCSNMKLSSGPARIGDYRKAGIHVGIGSDGEKENNNLDLIEEMKFASLLQKVSTLDPTTGDPWDILDIATLDGAKALGLGDVTGSLEVGKRADVVMVDLRKLHFTPLLHGKNFNAAAHLVFSASGHDVSNVWVDGRHLVADGLVTSVDVEAVRSRAQSAAEELFERREAVLGLTPSPRNQMADP